MLTSRIGRKSKEDKVGGKYLGKCLAGDGEKVVPLQVTYQITINNLITNIITGIKEK
jgi:hypothetical protein